MCKKLAKVQKVLSVKSWKTDQSSFINLFFDLPDQISENESDVVRVFLINFVLKDFCYGQDFHFQES